MSSSHAGAVALDPQFALEAGYPAPVVHQAIERSATRETEAARLGVDGVTLAFGGVKALTDVSLAVEPGEIRAIIGPNGAGKSSLLNVISGLYRPGSGRVAINDHVFARVPTERLARLGVARTFQNLALFRGLSVVDNVVIGLTFSARAGFIANTFGTPRSRRDEALARDRANAVVRFLDLDPVGHRLVGTLPYGMQKRVELARALVARPRLLLLDEPMAGMTATEKAEMSGFIRAARDQYGTTIILIEHDIGVVMGLSDKVAVLDYGRKIADGPPAVVSSDQAVIDAYLGVAHGDEQGPVLQ